MKRYLIMRNNEQTGPFTLEQLKFQKIQSNDIVWVQGESDNWTYAEEIEELKQLIEPATGEVGQIPPKSLSEFPPFDNNSARGSQQPYADNPGKPGKTKFYQIALAASILAVVLLAGLLIKKSFEPEAVEIKDVALTPQNGEATTNSANFQNALSKEFIPVEKKPKKLKPKELKKMVSLQASKYEVKILGGIKDLDLTVENFSDHFLDEVIVKVEYLKPKGEVINSETITISGVKAGESKTVEVPPSTRGVKVNYTIEEIVSKEYKAVLEEL
jgi:hypothetical protein